MNVALIGALLVASTSVIPSCDDYDDDIANLQGQIDAQKGSFGETDKELKDALTQVQTDLTQAQTDLKQAQADLTQAQADLKQAQADIASAKDEASKAAAEAKAEAAQAKLDAANAAQVAAQAAQAAATAKEEAIKEAQRLVDELKAQIPDVSKFLTEASLDDYAKLTYVDAQVKAVTEGLDAATGRLTEIEKVMEDIGLTPEAREALKSLGGIQNVLAQLNTQQEAIDNFTKQLGDLDTKVDDNLKASLDSADKWVEGLRAEYTKVLENYVQKSDLTTTLGDYYTKKEVDSLLDVVNGSIASLSTDLQGSLDKVNTDLGTRIDDLNTELTDKINEDIKSVEDKVGKVNANLITVLGKTLRGLVFYPELYVGGIESFEYGYLYYGHFKLQGRPEDTINYDGKNSKFTVANSLYVPNGTDSLTYNPTDTIVYHLNPSTASLEGCELNFISREVDVVSRAKGDGTAANLQIVEGFKVEDGKVKVPMKADGPKILTNYAAKLTDEGNGSAGDIFALQAKVPAANKEENDTVITSDYAMLYGSKVIPQAIAFSKKKFENFDYDESADTTGAGIACTGKNKLYRELLKWPKKAVAKKWAITLNFDDETGFDLKDILCIHYKWETDTKNYGDHLAWAYGEEAQYGLKYNYELVKYTVEGYTKGEHEYATVDADGIVKPNKVGDRTTIGHEPLVLVTVQDEKKNVVLYGYVKVRIVDNKNKVMDPIAKKDTVEDCSGDSVKIDWTPVPAEVLAKLNMTDAEFKETYELELGEDGSATQWEPAGSPVTDATHFNGLTPNLYWGTVKENKDKDLVWSMDACTQQKVYERETPVAHSKTIYVRYKRKGEQKVDFAVYVPLTLTISRDKYAIESFEGYYDINPTVWGWNPDDKICKKPDVEGNPGMNVEVPGTKVDASPDTCDTYSQHFMDVFMGAKLDKLPAYAEGDTVLYFIGGYTIPKPNGGEWKIVVKENMAYSQCTNKQVPAPTNEDAQSAHEYPLTKDAGVYVDTLVYIDQEDDNHLLATIDPDTKTIKYATTEAAKELLNAYGTTDKREPKAFLRVGVALTTGCGTILPVTDNWFDDYILRPVNVVPVEGKYFTDALDNGSPLNVADLIDLSDWRNNGNFSQHLNYYHFYGVDTIKIVNDPKQILTNIDGEDPWKSLAETAPNTVLEYTEGTNNFSSLSSMADLTAAMGKITLMNNGTPILSEYKMRLPVIVKYGWGTVNAFIEVTVKPNRGY